MSYLVCIDNQLREPASTNRPRNPQAVINRFFDHDFRLPEALVLLHTWLRSAFSRRCYLERKEIINLFYFRERYSQLLAAAAALYQNVDSGALQEKAGNTLSLLDPKNVIANMSRGLDLWDSFPRYLSRNEIVNPYQALHKCFSYKKQEEWHSFLEELYEAATDKRSVLDSLVDADLYQSSCYLFKLLEACHLLKMRNGQKATDKK